MPADSPATTKTPLPVPQSTSSETAFAGTHSPETAHDSYRASTIALWFAMPRPTRSCNRKAAHTGPAEIPLPTAVAAPLSQPDRLWKTSGAFLRLAHRNGVFRRKFQL